MHNLHAAFPKTKVMISSIAKDGAEHAIGAAEKVARNNQDAHLCLPRLSFVDPRCTQVDLIFDRSSPVEG